MVFFIVVVFGLSGRGVVQQQRDRSFATTVAGTGSDGPTDDLFGRRDGRQQSMQPFGGCFAGQLFLKEILDDPSQRGKVQQCTFFAVQKRCFA